MSLKLVMDRPPAKVVEFLPENPILDYSKTDYVSTRSEKHYLPLCQGYRGGRNL